MMLETTGQGRARFHPNLYADVRDLCPHHGDFAKRGGSAKLQTVYAAKILILQAMKLEEFWLCDAG